MQPMNEAILEKLEFDEIRMILARFCATPLGRRRARKLRPVTKIDTVRDWFRQVVDLQRSIELHDDPPLGGIHDVFQHIRASGLPAPLEPDVLTQIAETLQAAAELRTWIERTVPESSSLYHFAAQVGDHTPIANAITDAIDDRTCVRDHASTKLASIRKSIEQARAEIKTVYDRLLRHSNLTRMLQYAGATFHRDRMVLPLKAEHRGRIKGIIHRSSDSGATLFVEPAESVELNNAIIRLHESESKEITRILKILCQLIHADTEPILTTLRAIGGLDLIAAKVCYARKRSCVCPEIDEAGVLDIHEARHPLLIELFEQEAKPPQRVEATSSMRNQRREVVPINVRLGDDFDVLMITGPNTGGKTVCLKTVGLLALMTQCGIPIPAAPGSRMTVYKQIFMDIGDEQSLQQSLSTFSSHLATQLGILQHSGPRTLALIDELGAGTDPDEGAAIGRSIITELLRRKAKAIVTTHLSALKAVAFTTDRVDNACVEFDSESLKPTYHLRIGEPGTSQALIIAQRLGMSDRLVELAKGFLDQRGQSLTRAIAGTLDSRRDAERARQSARLETLEALRRREEYDKKRIILAQQQTDFENWSRWIGDLKPRDEVRVKSLKRTGTIVRMQLHQQKAVVSVGSMDIEVPLRDLMAPGS